jgi:hypothetical protein
MLIKELIPFIALNKERFKVHCAIGSIVKNEPLFEFSKGQFKEWQDNQNNKNFEREYILSLIYLRKSEWLFAGIFKSIDVKEKSNGKYVYETELLEYGKDLIGRMVVTFGKDFRASYLLLENFIDDFELCEIFKRPYKLDPFPGFENVIVDYSMLKEIYEESESTWKSALSNVKGIYLITDRKAGKYYVGSAYGEDAFWQRWGRYIKNGHGSNKKLKELIEKNGLEYASNFQFAILEIRNMTAEDESIIQREYYWKNVLCSREFGYNDN